MSSRTAHITAAVAAALAAAAALAPAAHAAWPGTPGKIAYLERDSGRFDLKVATPKLGEFTTQTVHSSTFKAEVDPPAKIPTFGFPSSPAWSPDGTKLAYSAQIADPGLPAGSSHTAIYVWDVSTNTSRRITTPPDGVHDPDPDKPDLGSAASDMSPAWSPDGQKLAFVRFVAAGEDAPLRPQQGGIVRIVDVSGGGMREVYDPPGDGLVTSLSWGGDPDGASALVGYEVVEGGPHLIRLDPASGARTALQSRASAGAIADFDVAPSGRHVDYVSWAGEAQRRALDGSPGVALGNDVTPGAMRSSPTGNGPLHLRFTEVPGHGTRGGFVERTVPEADGFPGQFTPRDRWVAGMLTLAGYWSNGHVGRSLFDVQAQRLPIISLPGFAGSTIRCGADRLWAPGPFGNGDRLKLMTLADDGATDTACPGAGPTADPDDPEAFVNTALGTEIYAEQNRWIERMAPGDRGWRFGWDWRKAPEESLDRLDAFITRVLDTPLAKSQGADRVVLYGHSYGGLLMRTYAERKPERVARMLTAGTPYLGVPKPMFFLGFGIENPVGDVLDLDAVLPNTEAREFARHSLGVHHLLAGDAYGPWMTHAGRFQSTDATEQWLARSLGAKPALLAAARRWHARYDGFYTARGVIQSHAIVGTGLLSIGGVEVPADPKPGEDLPVEIRMVDGDVTVPLRSAAQGRLGERPLGDPVPTQAVCRIPHMALGGAPQIEATYTEYLLTGRTPRKTSGACAPSGAVIRVTTQTAPTPAARARAGARSAAASASGGDLLAGELRALAAASKGMIDIVDAPGSPLVVVQDAAGLSEIPLLADGVGPVKVTVTRWGAAGQGTERVLTDARGPLRVRVDEGAAGPGGSVARPVEGPPGQSGGAAAGATPTTVAGRPRVTVTALSARRVGGRLVVRLAGRVTAGRVTAVSVGLRAGRVGARTSLRGRGGRFAGTLRVRVRGAARSSGRVRVTLRWPGAAKPLVRTVRVAR